MYPLKISVDLMKICGAKVLAVKNANNQNEYVVAVPVQQVFIPRERNAAHLMLNAIPTPNSPFGDFLIKPFIKSEDYQLLNKEEKDSLPILGKATFLKGDPNKAAAQMAQVAGTTFTETVSINDVASSVYDTFQTNEPEPYLDFGKPS